MNLSLSELIQVTHELARCLPDGRIQEIRQPSPGAVSLTIRVPGETLYLRLDATPQAAWIGLAPGKGPTTTPMPRFLAGLRHDLTGARIQGLELPWDDRVVVLRCSTRDGDRSLVLELSGHHSNLIFLGSDGSIREMILPSRSHRRDLGPGRPYEPPVKGPEGSPDRSRISEDEESPASVVATMYMDAAREAADEDLRRRLLKDLGADLKRSRRTLRKIEEDLSRAEDGMAARGHADLLKASLYRVKRGMSSVDLEDWSAPGTPVTIPLDPRLGPAENLEALYVRYKKAKRSLDRIQARRDELSERVASLEDLRAEAEEAASEELDALRAGAKLSRRRQGGPRERQGPRLPYHEFRSAAGLRILVGRSAADNRRLTFQVARGHDAWMHVRGVPGSHVVIALARGQEPDPETLLDAALLAHRYSRASKDEIAEVSWTLKKHVRPAPGGNPGAVFVSKDRSLTVRADRTRWDRLTSTRE